MIAMGRFARVWRVSSFATLLFGLLAGCETAGGLGAGLSPQDRVSLDAITQTTLESRRTGESVNWRSSDARVVGTVTPIRTYENSGGQPCRDFQRSVTVDGRTEVEFGIACRNAKGLWVVTDRRYAYRNGRYPRDTYDDPYWDYPYGYPYGYRYPYRSRFMFGYGSGYRW